VNWLSRPTEPLRREAVQELGWSDLVPKEWDPTNRFRALPLEAMRDGDPRADRLLEDMRATWDNALTVSGWMAQR